VSEDGKDGEVRERPNEARAGTVTLVGRPNAGKSTLMNALLGEKVAIVSDKPQTTRYRLVGILSEARGQIVFSDTPGIHKPVHRMNQRMLQHAEQALVGVDVVCLIVDASERHGRGDDYLLELVEGLTGARICLLNKIDRIPKEALLPRIQRYATGGAFAEIVPISATTGDGLEVLLDLLFDRLPVGPPIYDPELLTVHPERFLVTELIREKLLELTAAELPFTTAVVLDLWREDETTGRVHIHASILVERTGQKKIVIGRQGRMVKAIGTAARRELETFLKRPVYLELHVKIERQWRENPRVLAALDREVYGGG